MSHPLNQDIDFKILFQNISVTIETYGAKQYKTGTFNLPFGEGFPHRSLKILRLLLVVYCSPLGRCLFHIFPISLIFPVFCAFTASGILVFCSKLDKQANVSRRHDIPRSQL